MLFESIKHQLDNKIIKSNKFKNKVITHYYKSSFGELRDEIANSKLQESWLEDNSPKNNAGLKKKQYHSIHNDKDIKPLALTPEHINSILHHTASLSAHTNKFLREKDKNIDHKSPMPFIETQIATLSSAFKDKNNTNRKAMTVFSGVPRRIGTYIMQSAKESQHKFPGFMSTSTNATTASNFAQKYKIYPGENKKHIHMIAFHLEPHTGMSIASHSNHTENEVLLPHGTIAHYSHTEEHTHPDGHTIFVHHMTVHSPK